MTPFRQTEAHDRHCPMLLLRPPADAGGAADGAAKPTAPPIDSLPFALSVRCVALPLGIAPPTCTPDVRMDIEPDEGAGGAALEMEELRVRPGPWYVAVGRAEMEGREEKLCDDSLRSSKWGRVRWVERQWRQRQC